MTLSKVQVFYAHTSSIATNIPGRPWFILFLLELITKNQNIYGYNSYLYD